MVDNQDHSCNLDDLKNQPEKYLNLIDKYVKIELIKSVTFYGFLHSIDPISKSVILMVPKEEFHNPLIIPGHAILNIFEESLPVNTQKPEKKMITKSHTDVMAKKKQLMDWLKWNMLPFTVSGENIVFRDVHLLPPYTTRDISTTNAMVAVELKKVIERMPIDFNVT